MFEVVPEPMVEHTGEPNKWQQRGLRAAVSLAGGLMAAAPFTAAHSNTTEVHDDVGALPATISLAPGHSSLDTGLTGKLYNKNFANHTLGIGADIKIDGPPNDLQGLLSDNPKQAIVPFVGLFQKPKQAAQGYEQALASEFKDTIIQTEVVGGLAAGGFLFGIASMTSELSPRKRKRLLSGSIGGLTVLSTLGGNIIHQEWLQEHQEPERTYSIAGTQGTALEGTVADNQLLTMGIERAVPFIQQEKEREKQANEDFLRTAKESIDAALARGDFTPPKSGETMVMALSDQHSNHDTISVYRYLVEQINEIHGEGTIRLVVTAGDNAYGSATEGDAVKEMSKITEEEMTINGNHDSPITESFEKDADINVLKGKTQEANNGIKVLGGDDPSLTKLAALFGFEDNVPRNGKEINEAAAGEKLKEEALKDRPNILMTHEAYEQAPILGIDDISQTAMDKWFKSGNNQSTTPPPGVTPAPPDIPADLDIYGHWHRKFQYRVVKNSDGRWSVVAELGTSGGASGSMSLSTLSTPWTTPAKEASAVLFTFDNETSLVNKIQEFTTQINGETAFHPTADIANIYGPAPVSAISAPEKKIDKISPKPHDKIVPEAIKQPTQR